jgi:hypothetical protein
MVKRKSLPKPRTEAEAEDLVLAKTRSASSDRLLILLQHKLAVSCTGCSVLAAKPAKINK